MKSRLRNCKQTVKGGFTWVLKRLVGPYRKQRKWLEQTQWYSRQDMECLQLKLLQSLVEHAYQTVPYYRNYMDKEGFVPSEIRCLDDIRRFPVLTKKDIQAAGKLLHSSRYPSFLTKMAHTGGTTGLRVGILRDLWSIGNEHAFVRRQFDWAGLQTKDVCAYLSWRIVCPPARQCDHPYWYDAAMKELVMSTFHLSYPMAPTYVDALKKYKVLALVGYPSAISTLAKYCLLENQQLHLKAVLTTSETLDPARRRQISEAFSCPVYDYYGGSERVCYIHTCSAGSYHILTEYGMTELLDVPGQNGVQKVIATGFWNRAMPLIRYDTGDLVVPSQKLCSCGRMYPCVEKIVGRENQMIVTPSGRELGATIVECIMEFILHDLKSLPILETQMVLHEGCNLVLEYVSSRPLNGEEERKMNELIKYHIPEDFSIRIQRVPNIRKTVSGKALSLVLKPNA